MLQSERSTRSQTRILVADDNFHSREGLRLFLLGEGHAVETARNGWQALQRLKEGAFEFDSDLKTEGFTAEGRLERQEIEAGALLILACAVGWSFARMWKPGMNDIPHSGCLPLEEYFLERSLPLEADEALSVNGRSWLTLK